MRLPSQRLTPPRVLLRSARRYEVLHGCPPVLPLLAYRFLSGTLWTFARPRSGWSTRLREQLKRNPSGSDLLRNSPYRSYLRVQGKAIAIDEAKLTRSERYDGKYVLRSNAEFSHQDVVLANNGLGQLCVSL